ncbi:MAG: hypothetical protein ACK46S_04610 [Bacteroidota bacterium]
MKQYFIGILCSALYMTCAFSCKKDSTVETPTPIPAPTPTPPTSPKLIFKFRFDSTQARLNAFGAPSIIPTGNAAISPVFNKMCAHYIELAPSAYTLLGTGSILYHAPETNIGGSTAIDFSKSIVKGQEEEFFSINLKDIAPGTYQWLRVSLAYQNYDIKYKSGTIYGTGTIASFIGYNTYITNYVIKNQTVAVNANKLQGYWGFETNVNGFLYNTSGQAPAGATTVPNPISATSPIPAGSCVVTGAFISNTGITKPLVISGNETSDIVITVSVSTNKSFEWQDTNPDGYFEPSAGENVVDMGVRGMIPIW